MAEAPVRKKNQTASAQRRGSRSSGGGAYGVPPGRAGGVGEPDDEWVVVEPEADIAAKGHAYISFDKTGVYTP